MFGLPALFTKGKLFACVTGKGDASRMPPGRAEELSQRPGFEPFRPGPGPPMSGWVQVNRQHAADYAADSELIETALADVAAAATGKPDQPSRPPRRRVKR